MLVDDSAVRNAALDYVAGLVARSPDGSVTWAELNAFAFDGRPVHLAAQPGIWKPAMLDAALTIRTAYTPPGGRPPYEDVPTGDGLVRYKYRGTDRDHPDNRALREALARRAPLIYLIGVAKGVYSAHFPAYVIDEDAARGDFVIALEEDLRDVGGPEAGGDLRRYVEARTRRRLHQQHFRVRVLRAYDPTCAVCRLRRPPLLDAAHIVRDRDPDGLAVVRNGLALCKIHHAAYDEDLLGITPEYRVDVRPDLLHERDGPMLRHGLQEMHGVRLTLPRYGPNRPDRERLAARYDAFRARAS